VRYESARLELIALKPKKKIKAKEINEIAPSAELRKRGRVPTFIISSPSTVKDYMLMQTAMQPLHPAFSAVY
jgi:hypothetical protein